VGHSLALKGGLQKGGLPLGREKKLKLFTTKYKSSGGLEYFLSYESPDRKILYAFLRLRIPDFSQGNKNILPELSDAALIRELHTYGHLVPISKKQKGAIQHFGLGKKLMSEAEKIVKKLGIKKIAIISGIGVREYYQKLGYRLEGTYMVKELK
jgi:elongator complex protein 3